MWSLLLAAFFNENPVLIHHRQRWIRKQHLVCLRSFLGERGQCHYVEVERKEREGRSLALPLPFLDLLFWVCCGVRDLRKVLKHLNVEARPAEPSCELAVNAVCYETQAPKCQCICNTFQGWVRRPGAVDEFFIFFIYLFCSLGNLRCVGSSSSCWKIIRLQRIDPNGEGRRFWLCHCVWSARPFQIPCPGMD